MVCGSNPKTQLSCHGLSSFGPDSQDQHLYRCCPVLQSILQITGVEKTKWIERRHSSTPAQDVTYKGKHVIFKVCSLGLPVRLVRLRLCHVLARK